MEFWKSKNKPVIITEYGADTVAGLHGATPNMFTEEYQVDYYQTMNKILDSCSFVRGEHVWNFADFATIQGVMRVDGNKKACLPETESLSWLHIISETAGIRFRTLNLRKIKKKVDKPWQ